MNSKYVSAACIAATAALFIAAAPQISIAKSATTTGKYGPLTPNTLEGAYQMISERNIDPKTKKWVMIPTVGVWTINLTKVGPGSYQFPGFKDILHGSTKTCSGFLTDAGMAVTGGGGKHPKPKPNPVRFVIRGLILTEYQRPNDNRRFIFKKVADNPAAWNQIK